MSAKIRTVAQRNLDYRCPHDPTTDLPMYQTRAERVKYLSDCYMGNTYEADVIRANRIAGMKHGGGPSGIRSIRRNRGKASESA